MLSRCWACRHDVSDERMLRKNQRNLNSMTPNFFLPCRLSSKTLFAQETPTPSQYKYPPHLAPLPPSHTHPYRRHSPPAVSQTTPTTRPYAWSAAAVAPRVSTRGWGTGVTLKALPSSAGGGDLRGAFSTAAATGGDGEGKDDNNCSTAEAGKGPEAEKLAGAKGAEAEAPPPVSGEEENPLAGVVADDGDPGPPPPLDPSIVTGPSDKVCIVLCY